MFRLLDLVLSLLGLVCSFPILLIVFFVCLYDTKSPIFRQERVGRYQVPFILVKFRNMSVDTASVASHLASTSSITRLGGFLRRTKLDELPQLWNVLKGEMSLVGPRPGLFNQSDLIQERIANDVYRVRPGITGLAQLSNVDMSTPVLLAKTDAEMIKSMSIKKYFLYIFKTIFGSGAGDRVVN